MKMSSPRNFSWIFVNKLAGSSCPRSEAEMAWLKRQNIKHIITLSDDFLPPQISLVHFKHKHIFVQEFQAPTLSQMKDFIAYCRGVREQHEALWVPTCPAMFLMKHLWSCSTIRKPIGLIAAQMGEACSRCGCKIDFNHIQSLLVHCRQGLGRTGVMLACYLIEFEGMNWRTAIQRVRELRPWSIETREQEIALFDFSANRQTRK